MWFVCEVGVSFVCVVRVCSSFCVVLVWCRSGVWVCVCVVLLSLSFFVGGGYSFLVPLWAVVLCVVIFSAFSSWVVLRSLSWVVLPYPPSFWVVLLSPPFFFWVLFAFSLSFVMMYCFSSCPFWVVLLLLVHLGGAAFPSSSFSGGAVVSFFYFGVKLNSMM